MAFVQQEDILNVFEGLTRHLLKEIKGIEVEKFPRITYDYAMKTYGNDKPDIRFGMEFGELNELHNTKSFRFSIQLNWLWELQLPEQETIHARKLTD
jgi:aspartyl-tRNA synthetase